MINFLKNSVENECSIQAETGKISKDMAMTQIQLKTLNRNEVKIEFALCGFLYTNIS